MLEQMKPYVKRLCTMKLKEMAIIYLLLVMLDCFDIILFCYILHQDIDLIESHRRLLFIMPLVLGVKYSAEEFDGLMRIRGSRRDFLLSGVIVMVGISFTFTILDGIVMNCITYIGSMFRPKGYFLSATYYSLKDIGINGVVCLFAISSGFLIGSIYYVMATSKFITLAIIVGIIGIMSYGKIQILGTNFGYFEIWWDAFRETGIWGYALCIPIFIIVGILILYKAPIKAYAHSLGQKG